MKVKYPWPASQLDADDMEKLYAARQKTGRPITRLIKAAIREQYKESSDDG